MRCGGLDIHLVSSMLAVFKSKDVEILLYYSGVLVSGKSLDCILLSFGLIWVASPPNTPLLILAKSTIH